MENDIYKRFLELAGFTDPPLNEEMEDMLLKWKEAAKRLGLTKEDHKYAVKHWIPRNFEVNLEGWRKTIGMWVAEISDIMMAKEYRERGKKLVYGVIPAHSAFYRALKLTDPEVNVYFPDASLASFLNPFFHKIAPLLEDAEMHGIRYGCRHCALNKTRYALIRKGLIPTPDASWIWGFACDQAPKSDEFIREYFYKDYPIIFSRIPHDQPAFKVEYKDDKRVKYLGSIMRAGYHDVCERIGIDVEKRAIKEAFEERFEFILKFGEVMRLQAADPTPYNGNITVFLVTPSSTAFNTGYEYANLALDAVLKDMKERVDRGEGVVTKGSPKAMAWFIPYNNPFISNMFDENGVSLAYGEGLLPSKAEFEFPRFTDPFDASAEAFLKSSLIVNWGNKANLAIEKMQTYNIDCMIWGFLDFDRWLGSDHKLCARYVEEKTGKPSFYIEGDIWEDRDYSEEALRTRIETVCEIVKARHAISA